MSSCDFSKPVCKKMHASTRNNLFASCRTQDFRLPSQARADRKKGQGSFWDILRIGGVSSSVPASLWENDRLLLRQGACGESWNLVQRKDRVPGKDRWTMVICGRLTLFFALRVCACPILGFLGGKVQGQASLFLRELCNARKARG